MDSIILIGFMGAGKSTIGKYFAQKQNCRFVDTDLMIEDEEGRKIKTIFETDGEPYFRELETKCLEKLLKKNGKLVIAVGGGLPMKPENQVLMKKLGKIIYLKADTDTLVGRLTGDTDRPMLKGGELRERILTLMGIREETYKMLADLEYETDHKTIEEVIEDISRSVF